MEVIPAIDLRGGRCVRLVQGDYDRETQFSDDPVAVARRWADLGAPRLHVVDLDGAREGRPVNDAIVRAIMDTVDVPVQVGGGVRDLDAVARWLDAGAGRVVLGTAAVRDPQLAGEACRRYGDRVAIAIDAREGLVVAEGWREGSDVPAEQLLADLTKLGARRFIYTDVTRDGTLTAPNFAAVERLLGATGAAIIASGGVAEVAHLVRLAELGVEGAIVGRALYDGGLDLRAALAAVDAVANDP